MKLQLFIMVKEPQPGRVKTRLGKGIGLVAAAWWFRHQTQRLIRALASDPRWQTTLAVSPDDAGLQSRVWPTHLRRWPQGQGDLGDRMGRIFRQAEAGPVIIIGADIPNITPRHIADAFRALANHDAVFGPAPDGGYWLIGLKRINKQPAKILQNVRWSSEHALVDSMASLGTNRIAITHTMRDVDTVDDLQ